MNRPAGALAVLVAIAAAASAASAKDAAFAFAPDTSLRTAPIRVTNAFSFGSGMVHHECVSWVNRSTKTVVAIRFVFTYVDASGVIRGVDPFDRRGSFPPGVANEGVSSMDQAENPLRYRHLWDNCRGYTLTREGIAINRLSIERVDYDDGTSWLAPAASPSPAVVPPAGPSPSPAPTLKGGRNVAVCARALYASDTRMP